MSKNNFGKEIYASKMLVNCVYLYMHILRIKAFLIFKSKLIFHKE